MQGFCRNCFPTFQWKQLLKTIGLCFLKRNVLRFLWLLSCKQSTPHFPTYGQSNLNDQLKDTVKVNEVLVWKYTYGKPRWQTGVQSSFWCLETHILLLEIFSDNGGGRTEATEVFHPCLLITFRCPPLLLLALYQTPSFQLLTFLRISWTTSHPIKDQGTQFDFALFVYIIQLYLVHQNLVKHSANSQFCSSELTSSWPPNAMSKDDLNVRDRKRMEEAKERDKEKEEEAALMMERKQLMKVAIRDRSLFSWMRIIGWIFICQLLIDSSLLFVLS